MYVDYLIVSIYLQKHDLFTNNMYISYCMCSSMSYFQANETSSTDVIPPSRPKRKRKRLLSASQRTKLRNKSKAASGKK